MNIVVTQTNYTNGKIFTTDGLQELKCLNGKKDMYTIWASDQEDYMERVM